MALLSFACRETEVIFKGQKSKTFSTLKNVLERKLAMLDAAITLLDLAPPPANHLEPLDGARIGQHSIRVTGEWRLCFVWTKQGPEGVECVDYHDERRH